MSEHYLVTIEALKAELKPLENRVLEAKRLINQLCQFAGIPPMYSAAELRVETDVGHRSDAYYNKPLNTAIKDFLARRKSVGMAGPATAEEIREGLIAGGYDSFPKDRDEATTGLRISLGKSSHTFVKLPNGSYGLAEWYGEVPKRAPKAKPDETKAPSADGGIGVEAAEKPAAQPPTEAAK